MLKHACDMNLEGIISKRRDAPYRAGRNGDWLKIKCSSSQEFVVAGYEPSDVSPKRDRARWCSAITTRLACTMPAASAPASPTRCARFLEQACSRCASTNAAVRQGAGGRARPRRCIGSSRRWWSRSISAAGPAAGACGRLRSRDSARTSPRQVVREIAECRAADRTSKRRQKAGARRRRPAKARSAVTVAGVTLTHPDRVYWDDAGVTKQMLAEYYEAVWDRMAPHVAGRVLALVRCPDGVGRPMLLQKHASAGIDQEQLHLVTEPDGEKSISIDDLDGLVALVQAGVLEIHVCGSTIDASRSMRTAWCSISIPAPASSGRTSSRPRATCASGLGVEARKLREDDRRQGPARGAADQAGTPWDEAKNFCRAFAEEMAADEPERYVATIKKSGARQTASSSTICATAARPPRSRPIRPARGRAHRCRCRSPGTSSASQKSANAFTVLNLSRRLSKQARILGPRWPG